MHQLSYHSQVSLRELARRLYENEKAGPWERRKTDRGFTAGSTREHLGSLARGKTLWKDLFIHHPPRWFFFTFSHLFIMHMNAHAHESDMNYGLAAPACWLFGVGLISL